MSSTSSGSRRARNGHGDRGRDRRDGRPLTPIVVEQEPGSASLYHIDNLVDACPVRRRRSAVDRQQDPAGQTYLRAAEHARSSSPGASGTGRSSRS